MTSAFRVPHTGHDSLCASSLLQFSGCRRVFYFIFYPNLVSIIRVMTHVPDISFDCSLFGIYFRILFYLFIKCLFSILISGKAVPFVELTVAHASVLTILAISFERYYAICEPLRAGYVCTKTRAMIICLLAWGLAALFTR